MSEGQSSRFERFLEQASRVASGAGLHPVSVLEAIQVAARNGVVERAIPNAYEVRLSLSDSERFAPGERSLIEGATRMLREFAAGQRLTPPGPWSIAFVESPQVATGQVSVHTWFRGAQPASAPIAPGATQALKRVVGMTIRTDTGISTRLTHTPFLIGRAAGCDLIIPDMAISRRHAEIRSRGAGAPVVVDLGSRNRVVVGEETFEEVALDPGVRVKIGNTTLWIEDSP